MQTRKTRQQQIIELVFERVKQPLTAAEILNLSRELLPKIGQATVYRKIRLSLESGFLRVVDIPGKSARYEKNRSSHCHYFICRKCQGMLPLKGCPGHLHTLVPKDCVIDSHELIFYGFCALCHGNKKVSSCRKAQKPGVLGQAKT